MYVSPDSLVLCLLSFLAGIQQLGKQLRTVGCNLSTIYALRLGAHKHSFLFKVSSFPFWPHTFTTIPGMLIHEDHREKGCVLS